MTTPLKTVTAQPLPLEDIIPPATINSWPPAIGWWLVLFLLVVVISLLVIAYRRYKKKWGYRKEALVLLQAVYLDRQEKKYSDAIFCQKLFNILKRTAMTAYPEKNIGSIHGKEWINALKKQAPDLKANKDIVEAICLSQYKKTTSIKVELVYQYCEKWVKQHKSQWQGATS